MDASYRRRMVHEHARQGHSHHAAVFDHLDDETVAFARHRDDVLDRIAAHAGDPSSVLDLGAGNGVAAIGLARRFPSAQVTAIDAQDTWFGHLRERAEHAAIAGRLQTVLADIDTDIPVPRGSADLVVASNCLHHVADAGAVLRRIRDIAADGALLCVVESARPLRILADDDPAAPAEARIGDVLGARLRAAMPLRGARWAEVVAGSGWTVIEGREVATTADPVTDPAAARHALRHLGRLAAAAVDHGTEADADLLADAVERAKRDPRTVSWGVDGSRIVVLARPAHTADTR
jgi:SAM-dependent methyltransferase